MGFMPANFYSDLTLRYRESLDLKVICFTHGGNYSAVYATTAIIFCGVFHNVEDYSAKEKLSAIYTTP